MKIQDALFFILLAELLYKHNPRWCVLAGLASLVLAIPLFASWTFFTAERLTWYAAAFLLVAIIINLTKLKKE